ncbi:hypothetical protein ACP4OV_027169 [Aristida adscensionis]
MNHKNIVKFRGYCIGESNLTMITEYISKGNLDELLHTSDISIPLDIRLGIAIGCAEALSYMHSLHLSSENLVCHGDIKPANILLDDNLTAKVSDFGLSRLLSGGITQYTSNVKGSRDYMDPIYLRDGCLSPRSDVYSLGAVMLELIARRRVKQGNISLIGTLCKASDNGIGLRELFDAEIANSSNAKILEEIARLAAECLRLDIDKRPEIHDVAERLRILWKILQGGHEIGWRNMSFGIFKRTPGSCEIQTDLHNVRFLTKEEIKQVTKNYSCRLACSTEVYKGRLEDNTVVAVKKFAGLLGDSKDSSINGQMILSQIKHRNIIKLLGYCLGANTSIFVYEYATRGNLYGILKGRQDFPLDSRLKIALKTAEALEYLHSSEAGIVVHSQVVTSNIFLDDNFMPKLTGFSGARRLIKYTEITAGNNATSTCHQGNVLVKSDVYDFGVLLLALITRQYCYDLISQFTKVYLTDNRGKEIFDKDISGEENISILEEIGMLALKCIHVEEYERPTMKEVAARLRMLRS